MSPAFLHRKGMPLEDLLTFNVCGWMVRYRLPRCEARAHAGGRVQQPL